jgi:hypothetical protein
MLRGTCMTCPGCGGPMVELEIALDRDGAADPIVVEVCESCRGVWFDWFDGEISALACYLEPVDVSAPRGRAGGACPRDGAQLVDEPYLDQGPLVGRCPTCYGLFVRRDRIPALQEFHSRMPDRR